MLGVRAVLDVTGAELLEVRDDVVEIPERLAQDEQHVQQRLPLAFHVDVRKERPHRRRRLEQIVVERPHQLVALRSDEVEALLERLDVDCHKTVPLPLAAHSERTSVSPSARRDKACHLPCSSASSSEPSWTRLSTAVVTSSKSSGLPRTIAPVNRPSSRISLRYRRVPYALTTTVVSSPPAASPKPIESRSIPGTFSLAGCGVTRYAASPPTMFAAATCACSTQAGQSP